MAVLSGIAAAVPRRYYPDREEYSLLDEYAVAEGCDEREVMEQISFGEQGDILFDDVFDTSFGDRKLVPYAPLIICCVPSTKAAFKLILRRCSRRSLPPPPTCRWRSPSVPVADGGAVVEKSVFGILHETRQLWVQLLCGQAPRQRVTSPVPAGAAPSPLIDGAAAPATAEHDAVSSEEAEAFISNVIQICINLMHENDARNLMQLALGCVEAWLQKRSWYSPFLVAPVQLAPGLRDQFPPSKFLPALQRLAVAHDALGKQPDWLQPKGVGVVCVAQNGMPKDSFVAFYFGKM